MKKFILWVHQFPQNLIGFVLSRSPKHVIDFECNDGSTIKVYFTKNVFNCGVSLGNYVILDDDVYYEGYTNKAWWCVNTINHEHGHQIQSRYFGWTYLIFVGVVSAIFNNLWDRIFHKNWTSSERSLWYYNRYPERWADRLGKVKR